MFLHSWNDPSFSSACASYTSRRGSRPSAIISEKITVRAVTSPKSRITGIGENHSTRNPMAVVSALRQRAAPVVELVILSDSHGGTFRSTNVSNRFHIWIE